MVVSNCIQCSWQFKARTIAIAFTGRKSFVSAPPIISYKLTRERSIQKTMRSHFSAVALHEWQETGDQQTKGNVKSPTKKKTSEAPLNGQTRKIHFFFVVKWKRRKIMRF